MELIINVPDKDANRVRAFLAEVEKPVPPNKGIPGVLISVRKGKEPIELLVRGINITARGLPETPSIKVGDIVKRKRDGAWGRVLSVSHKPETPLRVQASKECGEA